MANLYVARHGETDLNKTKVYYGWQDVSLNDRGIMQSNSLKNKLADEKFELVISSSLNRATHTAKIISGFDEKELLKFDDLRELYFGLWEGLHYLEIEKSYNAEWKAWCEDWKNYTIPDGESFKTFYERVSCCIKKILTDYKDKNILLVAHEGVLKVMAVMLLDLKIDDYWKFSFEFGCYSLFEIQKDIAILRKLNC